MVPATPRIDFLSPTTGAVGKEIYICGAAFGSVQGSSYVSFGQTRATDYVKWSDQLIVVRVPGEASGPMEVSVTTQAGTSNRAPFTAVKPPVIESVIPSYGPQGAQVEIKGAFFGEGQGPARYVSFNEINPPSYDLWSEDRIMLKVPYGLSGVVKVTVTTPMGSSDPAFLAGVLESSGSFLTSLLANLDTVVAEAAAQGVNNNPDLVDAALDNLDVDSLLYILEHTTGFSEELSAHLSPLAGAGLALGLSNNMDFLSTLIGELDAGMLADLLTAHPETARELAAYLDADFAGAVAGGLNGGQTFLTQLISYLDPAVIAQALDVNPGLTRDLIAALDGSLGEAVAEAINTDPTFIVELLANLGYDTGQAMAEGTNLNVQEGRGFLENVLRYLDADVAAAVGQALEYADADFIAELVGNLNADTGTVMGKAANANPDLMEVLMANLAPATAEALAEGLNASAGSADPSKRAFLTNLLAGLDSSTGEAVGKGLNAMAAAGADSALYAILDNTEEHTVIAIADALEMNTAFLDAVIKNLDGAALAVGLNAGLDPAVSDFLVDNLAATDADMMARVMNSTEGQGLTNELLAALSGQRVAQALGSGAQSFIADLVGGLDGKQTAEIMTGTSSSDLGHGLQMNLDLLAVPGLDQQMANAIDNSLAGYPNSLMRRLGMKTYVVLDFLGMTYEWLWTYTTDAGTGKIY
jgi:hypothetical protein